MSNALPRWQYVSQKNDASCVNNKRGMARRAKRNSSKRARRHVKKDLLEHAGIVQW